MDSLWTDGSRASQVCFISGAHKPVNLHQWGPGVRDVYALHYIMQGQGTLETGASNFGWVPERALLFFRKRNLLLPRSGRPLGIRMDGVQRPRRRTTDRIDTVFGPASRTASCAGNLGTLVSPGLECGAAPSEVFRADARLHLLLSYYMEYFPRETQEEARDYVWLSRTYIEQNYWKSTLTVAEIVQAVNLERSYLFRKFKEATGESISAYITACRIRRACDLLKTSRLSIQSIAYSVGYNDPLYFSRVFKRQHHIHHQPTCCYIRNKQNIKGMRSVH